MGNVQAGGHAPQGDIDSIPNLTIEASKLRDSLATLCTRAVSTLNIFHIMVAPRAFYDFFTPNIFKYFFDLIINRRIGV